MFRRCVFSCYGVALEHVSRLLLIALLMTACASSAPSRGVSSDNDVKPNGGATAVATSLPAGRAGGGSGSREPSSAGAGGQPGEAEAGGSSVASGESGESGTAAALGDDGGAAGAGGASDVSGGSMNTGGGGAAGATGNSAGASGNAGSAGTAPCECAAGACCDGCHYLPKSHFCGEMVRSATCSGTSASLCLSGTTRIERDYWNVFCTGDSTECSRWAIHTRYVSSNCDAGDVCLAADTPACQPCPD
jgi:hypothetical protein